MQCYRVYVDYIDKSMTSSLFLPHVTAVMVHNRSAYFPAVSIVLLISEMRSATEQQKNKIVPIASGGLLPNLLFHC